VSQATQSLSIAVKPKSKDQEEAITKPGLKSFQVEFVPEDWKFIYPEIVTVEAETAEQAVEKAAPIAGKGLRRQLASLAKEKGRICVAEAMVFDNAGGDEPEGEEFHWNI
jgi:hypothetical protein